MIFKWFDFYMRRATDGVVAPSEDPDFIKSYVICDDDDDVVPINTLL